MKSLDRETDAEINSRISSGSRLFHALKTKFIAKAEISKKVKMTIFKKTHMWQFLLMGLNPGL